MRKKDNVEAWYTKEGKNNDIVLSTKLELRRNINDFNFVSTIKSLEAERILHIIFDTFTKNYKSEDFQTINLSHLDTLGRSILIERDIIETGLGREPWRGIIVQNDGKIAIPVNVDNHLSIICFTAGFSPQSCYKEAQKIDSFFHTYIQFSSLSGIGYLTQDVRQGGTGMSISGLVSIKALYHTGLLERLIKDLLTQGFIVRGYYGTQGINSLASLFHIVTNFSTQGDCESQILKMNTTLKKIIEMEGRSRQELYKKNRMYIEDKIYRSISIAKYARFINLEESIEIIENLRVGLFLGLIIGIKNSDLTSLLYRIQPAHLNFVISSRSIIIEDDIKDERLKLDRLRTMVMQEVLKNADIQENKHV